MKCPTELRHVLRYVLGNSRKHELERTGKATIPALSDPHSSAPWFEELLDPYEDFPPGKPPIASPRTWLLGLGWPAPSTPPVDQNGFGSPLAPLRRQLRCAGGCRC